MFLCTWAPSCVGGFVTRLKWDEPGMNRGIGGWLCGLKLMNMDCLSLSVGRADSPRQIRVNVNKTKEATLTGTMKVTN